MRVAFNTFADGSLAILPATVFWRLRRSPADRIQLSIVFGLNILTCICSGIKTQYLAQLANRTDLTWATFDIFVWVTVELFLMIVCGTIPTLHPLLVAIQSAVGTLKTSIFGSKATSRGDTSKNQDDARRNVSVNMNDLVTIGKRTSRKLGKGKAHKFSQSRSSDHLFVGYESLGDDVSLKAYMKETSPNSIAREIDGEDQVV